jgi:hypothetical protein
VVYVSVGVGLGGFVLGLLLGHLVTRRGKHVRFGWHVTIETHEGPPPDQDG